MAKGKTNYAYIIRLDLELNKIQDLDLLLERMLFEARKVVKADAGSIYVTVPTDEGEEGTEKLSIKYSQNDTLQKQLPRGQKMIYSIFTVPINEKSISGYCAHKKELINVPDMYNISLDVPYKFNSSFDMVTGYKTVSSLTIPLISYDQRVIGVIQVLNAKDKSGNVIPFSSNDEILLEHFANNASKVLQRAFYTKAMNLRLIQTAEMRDPKETGAHVNRVAGYAVEIYDRWAFHKRVPAEERDAYRDNLKISSMLHDVGKVAISDTILKKPAKFTPEEFKIMQNHTIYGASLFRDITSPVDLMAKDIALTHHENWDGTGYPGLIDGREITMDELAVSASDAVGRKGEEIPLSGRIVALADVYDALCSRRVYKDPWTEDDVLDEIKKLSGSKFDPEIIDIFFEVLPSIKQTKAHYPDLPD